MKQTFIVLLIFFFISEVFADIRFVRVMFRDDPAHTAVIGWDQLTGDNVKVYFDTADHGVNYELYAYQQTANRNIPFKGMNNHFVRLSGLKSNTAYYFVIRDSEGVSKRFWFTTCPDNPDTRLSIIAGGDSRNNRLPRQRANRLVAKLKPHVVLFGGDMTAGDSDSEWMGWMQDWQESIHENGRIIPIVTARGNHEQANEVVYNLFDVPSTEVYYALTFGGSLIRAYTLNTEMSIAGAQTEWLRSDLIEHVEKVRWKVAQYHKPIRPHVGFKPEGNMQYANWAPLFHDYQMNLVVECDAHTVKRTWPLRPTIEEGSEEGFIRDDLTGTVYIGEGCWGAPLRTNDDNKEWTRNSASFNQFNWLFIDRDKIEVRTIRVDNEENVGEVHDADIFTPPANLDIWSPDNGELITIVQSSSNIPPQVQITSPDNGNYYADEQFVTIEAEASDPDGTISYVEFYKNGILEYTDNSEPYSASLMVNNGINQYQAVAYDDGGRTASSMLMLTAGTYVASLSIPIRSGGDDVEQFSGQDELNTTSSDLDFGGDNGQLIIGLHFQDVYLPQGVKVLSSNIQFTATETLSEFTYLTLFADQNGNSLPFSYQNPPGARTRTTEYIPWQVEPWLFERAQQNEQTPDLSPVIQSVVDDALWQSGNALSFIISGFGRRSAESFDGNAEQAPVMHIQYAIGNITLPEVSITSLEQEEAFYIGSGESIPIEVNATDQDGTIDSVQFLIDGNYVHTDTEMPYSFNWTPSDFGKHEIKVIATDNDSAPGMDVKTVFLSDVDLQEIRSVITDGLHDAMETNSGVVELNQPVMTLGDNNVVGLYFEDIPINRGSEIGQAFAQFTSDMRDTIPSQITIRGVKASEASPFNQNSGAIAGLNTIGTSIDWYPPEWEADLEGLSQRTVDLTRVIQRIVDHESWKYGAGMNLIFSGIGKRSIKTAESGLPAELVIQFEQGEEVVTDKINVRPQSVLIYPSDTREFITLENNALSGFQYELVDSKGSVLKSGFIQSGKQVKLNVETYAPGNYIIRFRDDDEVFSRRFVKQ